VRDDRKGAPPGDLGRQGGAVAFEVLGSEVSDPYPHGDDRFAVRFRVKAKSKETGEVSEMDEIAVYHVADGRIVREEFFYGMTG
jgi:ketosteroid isomerase-like protein